MHDVGYVIAGFAIGILTAYSGVGAGALLTPLLVLTGVETTTAIGSDLLFALVTKVVALGAYVRSKTIDIALLWRIGPAGVVGAIVGVVISNVMHVRLAHTAVDHTLRYALSIALLISAAAIIMRPFIPAKHNEGSERLPLVPLVAVGFFVGLIVSLTSVGAGSLTLPLLLLCVPAIALRRLVATDIAFAVVLLVPSLIGHFALGNVNVKLSGLLILGSVPGVFIGARINRGLSDQVFRVGVAGVLIVVSIAMMF